MTLNEQIERTMQNVRLGCIRVRTADANWGTDADSALYTGIALGAMKGRESAEFERLGGGVRNLLTSEDRLARMVVPGNELLNAEGRFIGTWNDRFNEGLLHVSEGGTMWRMGGTTRDQLTGILFGLIRQRRYSAQCANLATRLCRRVRNDDYRLLMDDGSHAPSAYKLDAPLRAIVDAVCDGVEDGHKTVWPSSLCRETWHYNRWPTRRFVWHLRLLQAATLRELGFGVDAWVERIMSFVWDDANPMFEVLAECASGHPFALFSEGAHENLDRAEREPWGGFFRWEKHPDEWWVQRPEKVGPAMDVWVPMALAGADTVEAEIAEQQWQRDRLLAYITTSSTEAASPELDQPESLPTDAAPAKRG